VETLHEMGFYSLYAEVIRFENMRLIVLGGDVNLLGTSVLVAVDNVDHNVITLDGKGFFMGWGSLLPSLLHEVRLK
jgi:hypothetical protein